MPSHTIPAAASNLLMGVLLIVVAAYERADDPVLRCQTNLDKSSGNATTGGRRTPMALSQASKDKLATVSTATLTTVLFKRGFRNAFIGGIKLLNPDAPRLI